MKQLKSCDNITQIISLQIVSLNLSQCCLFHGSYRSSIYFNEIVTVLFISFIYLQHNEVYFIEVFTAIYYMEIITVLLLQFISLKLSVAFDFIEITLLFISFFDKQEEEGEDTKTEYESDGESEWEPDPRAVDDPTSYRINTWESTVLGRCPFLIRRVMLISLYTALDKRG